MKEFQVEQALVRAATDAGGICWKWVSPSKRGVPDRIVVLNGNVCFVEVKSPTGQLSNLQKRIIARLRQVGADVRVVSSPEQAQQLIHELGVNDG